MALDKFETIKIEKQDGITWLILNRPEKRNAMSPQLHKECDQALSELATDAETQILILTGAGEAAFAGANGDGVDSRRAPPGVRPPLKWAGGKRWQVPHLISLWESHCSSRLVEPFCGGLAITLRFMPERALLNDMSVLADRQERP